MRRGCWGGDGVGRGGREDGKQEGMGGLGGVILLWKMYWSSWKNRSKKKEEQENLGVRGTGALACG